MSESELKTVEAGGRENFIELFIQLLVNLIEKETLDFPQNSPTSINSSSNLQQHYQHRTMTTLM